MRETPPLAAFLLALTPSLVRAQSLQPRVYLPIPVGYNVVATSYSHGSGSVVFDATLPLTDFRATINTVALGYVRAYSLLGRSAQVQVEVPLVSGTARPTLAGNDTSRALQGLADPQLRLGVNLLGAPARRRREMAGVRFGTLVGASLTVTAPLGRYENDRLLNIGTNRWSLKPEVGVIQPLGNAWAVEAYGGVSLFSPNTNYLDTSTVSQQPLWTLQSHVVRLFGRRGWAALDGTWFRGGTTSVDGVVQNTFQVTIRLGATLAWVLGGGHALKAAFSTGVYTRLGGDFDQLSVGYQYGWGR